MLSMFFFIDLLVLSFFLFSSCHSPAPNGYSLLLGSMEQIHRRSLGKSTADHAPLSLKSPSETGLYLNTCCICLTTSLWNLDSRLCFHIPRLRYSHDRVGLLPVSSPIDVTIWTSRLGLIGAPAGLLRLQENLGIFAFLFRAFPAASTRATRAFFWGVIVFRLNSAVGFRLGDIKSYRQRERETESLGSRDLHPGQSILWEV